MKFLYNNSLCLYKDDKIIFEGIKFWVKGQGGEKIFLKVISAKEKEVLFSNEAQDITARLNLTDDNRTASLSMNIDYSPDLSDKFGQNHLDTGAAAGIDISAMPEGISYMANYMRCSFWCGTKIFDDLQEMPERTQALLARMNNGEYAYLLTTCDKYFKSNIVACDNDGFMVYIYSLFPQSRCSECVLILGFSKDAYALPDITAEYGIKVMKKNIKIRKDKRYPDVFEYLGWCSWDAFHMDVTHSDLIKKADEFKKKKIPVRWMIIDDMWAECHNNNRATMHSREMYNFEADPQRFPDGLAAAIEDLKENYGMKVGVWYPTTGYWNGIDPEGPIAKEHSDLLTIGLNGRLLPSPDKNKLYEYFYMLNSFFCSCGADFVKVDYQSCILDNYNRLVPVGLMAKNLQNAIEATVGVCFDGSLINCMGMANENFWNRPNSIVNRISGDFMPEDRKWFVQHLIQCSFNSFAQGSLYTGDWDMWWSDDAQGTKNAVLRAMSGGPVYVSDELGRSVKEKIMPIVYSNGKIIRLKESARPTLECLFEDCEHNGKIFKVFNNTENGGIIAAFNIDEQENKVYGNISVQDIYGMQDCRCAVLDYFEKQVIILEKGEHLNLTLENYDDFRLYYVIKLRNITPVGLIDKYIALATFEYIAENKCIVSEGGNFGFIAENAPQKVLADGVPLKVIKNNDRLYSVALPKDKKKILLEWGSEL